MRFDRCANVFAPVKKCCANEAPRSAPHARDRGTFAPNNESIESIASGCADVLRRRRRQVAWEPIAFFSGLLKSQIAMPAATPSTSKSVKNISCDHVV